MATGRPPCQAHFFHSSALSRIRLRKNSGEEMTAEISTTRHRSRLSLILFRTTALVALGLPMQAAAQEGTADQPYVLAPIIIQSRLQYTGEIDGYLARGTETGVKSGVPLSEVPQSITVVTSTELEKRQPRQVEDAIKYSAGINPSTWGTDDRYDQFSVRGFDIGSNSLYRDGLPQKSLNFNGFSSDPYMLERVDILRGPAGVLYGSNDAGGMVNLVTKRPVFERLADAQLGYGSHGTAEVGFDVGNVLNKDGTLAGRITGLWRDGETQVDPSQNDRAFLAAGLTWAPTDHTSVTVLGHVQKDRLTPIGMSPIAGEDYDTAWGRMPSDFAYKQSDYNHFNTEQQSIGWDIRHEFSKDLILSSRARYAHQTTDYAQLDYSAASEAGLSYYPFRNDEEARTFGIDTTLEWKTNLGAADNSLVIGADYQHSRNEYKQYLDDGIIYTVPFDDPNFDFDVTDPALSSKNRATYTEKGIYLQNHMKFDNGFTLTAGLRRSWFENEAEDLLAKTLNNQKDSATTGMIGGTYDYGNGLTQYLSYTEGFIQNVGTTIDNQTLDPSRNKQWETGLRYETNSGDLLLGAAVFDLRKTNVKDYDLRDPTWGSFSQVGEIRSRGIELEARGRVTDTLQAVAAYTYLDTEITKSADPSKLGNQNAMAPHNQVSLWLDWDAARFVPGLSVGAGLRYNSSSYSTQANIRETPSYTLADLSVRYEVDPFTVDLGVTNLFDREYYGVCYDNYGCSMGEGREVSLTLKRSF